MVALTNEQYNTIISTIKNGTAVFRANARIAAVLTAEANLGMRIGDILRLRLSDIIKDGGRYRLNIVEEKTGKRRTFTVPAEVYGFLREYAARNGIAENDLLFPICAYAVQKHLKKVCDYLGYKNVSTHSFRKFYATEIYHSSGYNIALVQQLLQHSSAAVTQKYIGIQQKELEQAIENHLCLDI